MATEPMVSFEDATQQPVPNAFVPAMLPQDVDGLTELKDQLNHAVTMATAPQGTKMLIRSIDIYMYRKPKFDAAQQKMQKAFDYVHGKRGNGARKGAKIRSMRSTAYKFYNTMGEASVRKHCSLYGLNYDSFETVDARIEALVAKSAELV